MNRALMTAAAAAAAAAGLFAVAGRADAAFLINEATGPIAPSFRGQPNTTHFGWNAGAFDGATNNELIDSPAPNVNPAAVTGMNLVQNNAVDILSSGNNIYGSHTSVDLTLTVPVAGSGSTGFTTLLVQSTGLSGASFPGGAGLLLAGLRFGPVNGVSPEYVFDFNAEQEAQGWWKYKLPGRQATYAIPVTGMPGSDGAPLSVTDLIVDTQWSPTAYATDVAVPEPTTAGLVGVAACGLLAARRKRRS